MRKLLAFVALGLLAAPSLAQPPANAHYARRRARLCEAESWLCRPGRQDACGRPLETAALDTGGYGPAGRARSPPTRRSTASTSIPTVSRDPGLNSDMIAGPEEHGAPLSSSPASPVCRPFAPVYRQATIGSIAAR